MLQDLRLGIRMLLQNKGWTVIVILSLFVHALAQTAMRLVSHPRGPS